MSRGRPAYKPHVDIGFLLNPDHGTILDESTCTACDFPRNGQISPVRTSHSDTVQCNAAGNNGEWKYVAHESSDDTFVFVRGAAVAAKGSKSTAVKGNKAATKPAATAEGELEAKPVQKRKKVPASEQETPQPRTTRRARAAK